jgi:hypothetical protein
VGAVLMITQCDACSLLLSRGSRSGVLAGLHLCVVYWEGCLGGRVDAFTNVTSTADNTAPFSRCKQLYVVDC